MKTQFKIVATTDDALEALKHCEYALRDALSTDRIGWIQQVAHKNAVAALEKLETAKRPSAPSQVSAPDAQAQAQ